MMTVLFWCSLFCVFHAYFGYPFSLYLLWVSRRKKLQREPKVYPASLIITAFNEEGRIRDKIENSLALDYPDGMLQILVASDGSTDSTNEIVKSYADKGVELLEVTTRGGKENAQKEAIAFARGEILIFSDVATILERDGVREIVANFSDPTVGCVSSEDRLIGQDGKHSGEGLYVRYEMWLRRLESKVNSLVGLSGSFFAARREVCLDFSGDVQSDFRTLLSSIKLGLRGVSDPKAIGSYLDIADEKRELERKVRTVVRGLTVFFRHLEFLNIFRFGLFSYQLFCHKMLRWLVPFFLVTAMLSSIILAPGSPVYFALLSGQIIFYGIGLYGILVQPLNGIMKVPMFFITVNAAISVAWWQYALGKRVVLWTPSQR